MKINLRNRQNTSFGFDVMGRFCERLLIGSKKTLSLFSSREHEVLDVRYCDRSVVRPSVRLSVRPFTITKKKSSPKLKIKFQSNFTGMILRSCSFKRLQRIEFPEEQWLPWQQSEKTLKIFLSQTVRAKAVLYQNTSNYGPGVEINLMF